MKEISEIDKLKKEIQIQQNKIDSLIEQIDKIKSSRSWRITAPYRALGVIVRGLYHLDGELLCKGIYSLRKEGVIRTIRKVETYLSLIATKKINEGTAWHELITIDNLCTYIVEKGGRVYGREFIKKDQCSFALLVSHEASLTGAPMALRYMGLSLLRQKIVPIFLTPIDGGIVNELQRDGIVTIVFPDLLPFVQPWMTKRASKDSLDLIYAIRNIFDIVIANTIITAPIVSQLVDTDTPVLWWIHEAEESYSDTILKSLPSKLSSNIKVFAGGDYAKKVLEKYRPEYSPEVLLYPVPDSKDLQNKNILIDKKDKFLFMCVGTLQARKAQDKLVEGILKLPQNIRDKAVFLFVGKNHSNEIYQKIKDAIKKFPQNIKYISEISQQDLNGLYSIMDVLVCPSLDDPMPIVITDALCRSKLVLCADSVGTATLIKNTGSGVVYPAKDTDAMAIQIQSIIESPAQYALFENKARDVYLKFFSPMVFERNLKAIIDSLKAKEVNAEVSVVIPTLNGGDKFEKLIDCLKQQVGLEKLEIIVVDSGSHDDTLNVCKRNDVRLIEIPQEKFTHSYARNLGASYACGNIILFMTQDALPSSNIWLRTMIDPLINENVAATSCLELCPPDTDLFYKCKSSIHNKFMSSVGQFCAIEQVSDHLTLRKNASLNDTNCAIKASIFKVYQYRNSYAEDLDLGIRLIKKGYRLKYIKDNPVIHGHNRNPDYYLKRSYIETMALGKMFNDSEPRIHVSKLYGCCFTYSVIRMAIDKANERVIFPQPARLVIDRLQEELCKCKTRDFVALFEKHKKFKNDSLLYYALNEINNDVKFVSNNNVAVDAWEEVFYFLNTILRPYICDNYKIVDKGLFDDISNCIIKQFAIIFGNYLARTSEFVFSDDLVQKLKSGV